MKKIKIGLVGLGRISTNHINAIKKNSKYFKLTALCDIDAKKSSIAKKLNLPFYTNYKKFLNDDIDIVALCTPSGLHCKQSIIASKNLKHVITEKPMATKINDAKKMINAANSNSVKLFVVKQNRFNPTLEYLKKLISKNILGKIYMFNTNVFWHRSQSYYDSAKWRGTKKLDGGALMNQASHYVDMIDWFFGPMKKLNSFCITKQRKIEVEDSTVVNFVTNQDVIGSINVSMLAYEKNFEGSLTIIAEKGNIVLGGIALNTIQNINLKDKKIEKKLKSLSYKIKNVYGNGHFAYYKNVAENLKNKKKASTDGHEGLKSLNLIVSAYTSSKNNRNVTI